MAEQTLLEVRRLSVRYGGIEAVRDLDIEVRSGETVVVEGACLLQAEAEKRAGGGDEHGH